MSYDAKTFWNDAARHMASRDGDVEIASDSTPITRHKRALFVRKFLSQMPIEGRTILEVGSGPGGNLAELSRRGGAAKLLGADIAPEMVSLAQRRLGDAASIVLSAGKQLPFADREVDLAFTSTMLMHVLDDSDASATIADVCRVADKEVWIVEDTLATRRQRPFHVRRTSEWYSGQLEMNGFTITQIDHIPMLASRAMASAVNRLARGRDRGRGMPQPTWARLIEAGLLPITRLLDPVLPTSALLTRIIAIRD